MSINPAMFFPGVALSSAVQHVLEAIDVNDEQIRRIVEILDTYSDAIKTAEPGTVREGAYGDAWSGRSLDYHTGLAHTHVVKAMTEMVETLIGTGDRVRAYHQDITFRDEDARDRNERLRDRGGMLPPTPPLVGPPDPNAPPVLPPLVTPPTPGSTSDDDTVEA